MSWFVEHYAEVESQCNESRYVESCVSKQAIPGKFRKEMQQLGVVFSPSPLDERGNKIFDYESFTESPVPCTLPAGWSLSRGNYPNQDVLYVKNNAGAVCFSARVTDRRGYHTWSAM